MVKISLSVFEGSRVSELSLIVGDRPLGGTHHSQLVVSVWIETAKQSILSGEARSCHYRNFG